MVAAAVQSKIRGEPVRTSGDCARALEQLRNDSRGPWTRQQCRTRFGGRRGRLDQRDDVVNVRKRNRKSFEDMSAIAGLGEIEYRAAGDDFAPMPDERIQHL